MDWRRNLIASISSAFAAGISAYIFFPVVFGFFSLSNLLNNFFSSDFWFFMEVSLIFVTPIAFWLGPDVISKLKEEKGWIGCFNVSAKGVIYGVIIGIVAMIFVIVFFGDFMHPGPED